MRAGKWQLGVGTELAGSTLGVLGLGRVGPRIARYAKAFDMNVLAWSQNLTQEGRPLRGLGNVSKEELFSRSDIVTVHLKLSERTTGLVGAAELAALGPRGYLVNTSRGPIVDEKALVAALNNGTIAGAALDAYDVEPLPAGHPLLSTPNTVLSPHLGYVSTTQYKVSSRTSSKTLRRGSMARRSGSSGRSLVPSAGRPTRKARRNARTSAGSLMSMVSPATDQ